MASKKEIRDALGKAFDSVDADKSGSINATELKTILTQYFKDTDTPPCKPGELDDKIKEFMNYVDTDQNGTISKKEFVDFFETLLS